MMHAGSRRRAIPANSSRAALFREHACRAAAIFGISPMPELTAARSVSYRGTARADKMAPSIRYSLKRCRREIHMTLTVAHISPIMSVIAGVLILIMPRLLNLVVAVFLILNGLIGLGLLRWLHF
jgi:hypothetical protein